MNNIATNPFYSFIWISASAGTGKTKILVNRVLRLLVTGHKNILCLTFTNTAAHEMTERIHSIISTWAILKNEELKKALKDIIPTNITPKEYKRARELFNNLQNVSLSIKTIHSFCYQLISTFPIETGIAPDCSIKDFSESFTKIFHKLLHDPTTKHHLSAISHEITEATIYDLLYKLLNKQHYNFNQNSIYKKLNINNINNTETYQLFPTDNNTLNHLTKILSEGSIRDKKISENLVKWSNLSQKYKLQKLNKYVKIFINLPSLEKKSISSIITKKTLTNSPEIEKIVSDIQEEILNFIKTFHTNKIAERTIHLIEIAKCFTKLYQQDKQKLNYLDHNDIIDLALNLLKNPAYKDWILFHLDSKIDHILIDESQDNSIKQWSIILQLCHEFFSGIGTTEELRTLFIVGDIKQSIYGFQNARPDYFNPMCHYFTQQSTQYKHKVLHLTQSFRSTPPILKLVDKVFNNFCQEISFSTTKIEHEIFRKNDPGYVEIWPIIDIKNNKNFSLDFENRTDLDTNLLLASTIANKIHSWIINKRILLAKNRPITAGDFLILVRHRTCFIDHVITSLKKLDIPTLERDKFKIMDYTIIQDLVNLGEFLLLPENDLALTGLLKSPIFEFNEKQIFDLAYNRNNTYLWEELQSKFSTISNYLKQLISVSQLHSPLNLYHHIISEHKHKFTKRLGQSNTKIIGEFINLLIQCESHNINSLQAFIHWIKNTNPEIKSDINLTKDYVKIMTVHNAKGMQSPIVFLSDTTTIPKSDTQLVFDEEYTPFWIRNDINDFCENLKSQQKTNEYNEYLRLLYVAMTRAEDELYITGISPIQNKSWYSIIRNTDYTCKKKLIDLQPMIQEKAEVLYLDE
ncbi:uvrD/REP helicase N-terminal domain protein [Ehrlichia chaffeensis str. Liberty]|uniref:UvrD-helicase domain-containing protein n=1 Tax=Ehrlichia chaffeensis TaxID=945 RepID=UPI000444AA2F|nr:UvrD-helicase domain-containing protein [Ehrlichia chaffeensis]AHX05786.1 uvrD/REP helicase N-terminal domain protein [Ehrlichia chaffeensis str. Jax]AHX06778.1 uvrD/REP helicase N-terminal domain protein [Ehrlichia chaffeensis str. Liberty]